MGQKNSSLVDMWLDDDHLNLVAGWARDGVRMHDICERIGISTATFAKWRREFPEFDKAVRSGREIVNYKVENALLKAALGYTSTEIKVTIGKQNKNGQIFMITKETTTKEVGPNVTACLAWLNNKLPDKWKRNRDKEVEENIEDSNLKVTIIRGPEGHQMTQDESNDNVNREIQLSPKSSTRGSKNDSEDKDFWPEDWEDDED